MGQHAHRGITLIEMMIVIAILSVLLAVAVPSFSNLILSNQIAGNTSDFIDTLRRAKTEANAKLTPVTVCVRNGDDCSLAANAAWNSGWLIFLDDNGDGIVDAGERIIYEYAAFGRPITFRARDGNNNLINRILFTPSGLTDLPSTTTFAMCSQDATIRRGIIMTIAGHSSPLPFSGNDAIAPGGC